MGTEVIRQIRPHEREAITRAHTLRSSTQPDPKHHGVPRYLGGGGEPSKARDSKAPNYLRQDGKKAHEKGNEGKKGHDKKDARADKKKADTHGKKGAAQGGAGKEKKAQGKGPGKGLNKGKHAKHYRPQSNTEAGPGADSRAEPAGERGGDEGPDFDFIAIPPIPMARTGDFYPPRVEEPPPAVMKAEKSIITETGSPPKDHHAKVRLAMEAVTRAASESQLDMVRRVEAMAWDTRFSIEKLADQIPKVVEGGVGLINGTIDRAGVELEKSYEAQKARIANYHAAAGADLAANRENAMKKVQEELTKSSNLIKTFADSAAKAFDAKLKLARQYIIDVPKTGKGQFLPMPEHGGAKSSPQEREKESSTVPKECEQLKNHLENDNGPSRLETYEMRRSVPTLEGWGTQRQKGAEDAAQQVGKQIDSQSNRAQFLIVALGLTGPSAQAAEKDKPGHNKSEKKAHDEDEGERLTAQQSALDALAKSFERAKEFLEEQRTKLSENLRKMGRKIEKSLRNQARTAEVGIATAAAQMAQSYPETIKRLAPVVAPGKFLDARSTVPELDNAREGLLSLRLQHLQATREQAAETLKGAEQGFEEQRKEIWKAARESTESVGDGVTRAMFDFEVAADSFTGDLLHGAQSAMARAIKFAEKQIPKQLEKETESIKKGVDGPLEESAAAFLNNAISSQVREYGKIVEKTPKDWNDTGGPFQNVQNGVRSDLSTRTKNINDALPDRSWLAAVGLTVLSPVGGVAYLYFTRSDEDVVLSNLGEVPWPGAGAIEDMFNGTGPANTNTNYGKSKSLRTRIKDRMSDPQRHSALGLLSTNAGRRFRARKEVAESSTGTFTGPSKETREAVLRGFSKGEADYVGPTEVQKTKEELAKHLSGSELEITQAYLDRNIGRVLAIRVDEKLEKARLKGDDAMVQLTDEMQQLARQELGGTVKNAFIPQGQIDALLGEMYVEHSRLSDEREKKSQETANDLSKTEKQTQGATQLSPEEKKKQEAEARQKFLQRMKTRIEFVQEPGVGFVPVEKPVNDLAFKAIEAAITKTPEEAWIARAAYEFKRAEKDGEPSESTQSRITNAFEDQELFQIERRYKEAKDDTERAALKRQLDEARTRHDEKMRKVAEAINASDPKGPTPDLSKPGSATAYMANRLGKVFSSVDHGEKYVREMIQGGRASLLTGILLATDKWGTHEDLLRSVYAGRSKAEIAGAREEYARTHGGDSLDEMLGISNNSSWFGGEVSGDLAMELKKLSKGEPTSDRDFAELAALEHEQQRVEGTGFLAKMTMEDTPEAQVLDERKEAMAREILTAAGMPDGDPSKVFGPDGTIQEPYTQAFDKDGKLKGNRYKLRELSNSVKIAADNYKAEIDRQESILTSCITALAVLVTVVLLCIPGVNMVVAGILTAVISGAATIAAKAGMRGSRYGWEEAATDVGMTAIEAATAGIGGGLGRGAEAAAKGAKAAGFLGRVGAGLTKSLGKVGGAVAREAIVGTIGGAARTAIQDETWKDGIGAGLKNVALSGVKGAAANAVSTAVSQAVSAKLTHSLEGNVLDAAKASPTQRLGSALGPAGREMVSGVVSQTLGAMSATAVDIFFDVASGHYEGSLKDALRAIGETGLREMFSSTLRTGAELNNKARYRALLKAARENPGPLSERDLRALRLAAISAGEDHYGLSPEEASARSAARAAGNESFDPKSARFLNEVEAGRRAMEGLPESMRGRLGGLDAEMLHNLRGLMEHPTLGSPDQRLGMLRALRAAHVELTPEKFLADLQGGQSALQQRAQETAALHKQVRSALSEGLQGPVRAYIKDVPLEGLDKLPSSELQRAAEMIRGGRFDEKVAAQLFAAAKAQAPELSQEVFARNLRQAVETVAMGRQLEQAARVKMREDVLSALPEEGRAAFEGLPANAIRQVKDLLANGAQGSPQLRESLFRAAAAKSPGLERTAFFNHLDAAVEHAAAERNEQRRFQRQERFERLSEYPKSVRGQLSALPEESLFQLRLAQARGEEISPQLRQSLHEAALRETPGVDLKRLNAAMDEAVRQPAKKLTSVEGQTLRDELLAAVPSELRQKLGEVPVLVMKAEEFAAFTRSASGEAVTLIIDGRPVVVMKEGAHPSVLREEGLHALQSQEPRWREHIGALDEAKLAKWDHLPLEEQLSLYRGKVAVELDAQQRLISSLESALDSASRGNKEAVAAQLQRAKVTRDNLLRRFNEVEHLTGLQKRAIETGLVDRRQAVPFLDEAPRLFSKNAQPPQPKVIVEALSGPTIDSPLDLIQKNPGARVIVTEATLHPDPADVAKLRKAGATFLPENVSPHIAPSSVDEIQIRFPLAHDDVAEQVAFNRRVNQLREEFPNASDAELMGRVLKEGSAFLRQADSLTGYAPFALERLKPGGTLEVVFYEERIRDEVGAAGGLKMKDPQTGKTYQLRLEGVSLERRGDVAPKSGYGVPGVHDDMIVPVARFTKEEVKAVEPTGARGPVQSGEVLGQFSGREFFPSNAGGPVRELDFSRIRFTDKGIDVVEAHVKRFEGGGAEELAMVQRLRLIAAGKLEATDYDRAFYSHELRESVRYRRLGWPTGQPLDADASYSLWNDAHTATLEDYRLREKLPNGGLALFHPDVMAQQTRGPTGARGSPPVQPWDPAVSLGIRSGDAHDPAPQKGQCAAWVWVMIMRNAGWSGAVAVDPRSPEQRPREGATGQLVRERATGRLVRELRDPTTGEPLTLHQGSPQDLLAHAHGLAPGTQIVISVRTQRGVLHQMLGVVQGDGSLGVMHSYSPDRLTRPGGGVDRIYFAQQAELSEFSEHKWWVLPPIPPPPPQRPLERSAPLELEPPVRRSMERELHALGHEPEVTKLLTDAELFSTYSRAQAQLADRRIDEFRSTLTWQARGELDTLRASTELAWKPVSETHLRNRIQSALQTPVEIDSTLRSGEVQVRYKRGLLGNVTGLEIRCGAGATLKDILLHVPTLQAYRRYEGVAGVARRIGDAVRGLLSRGARIPPGSMAEEAWNEVRKIPAIIDARQRRLSDESLDVYARVKLELEIEQLESQLAGYARALADLGEGRGFVAAWTKADRKDIEAEAKKMKPADAAMLRRLRLITGADTDTHELTYPSSTSGSGADFTFVSPGRALMAVEQKSPDEKWEGPITERGAPKQLLQRLKDFQKLEMADQRLGHYLLDPSDPTHERVRLVAANVPNIDFNKAWFPLKDLKLLAVVIDTRTGQILRGHATNAHEVQTAIGMSDGEFRKQWTEDNGAQRRRLEREFSSEAPKELKLQDGEEVIFIPVTSRPEDHESDLKRLGAFGD